jgi:hypothetical protein
MRSQVTFNDFVDGFSCRPDNFSYTGLRALYDAFEDLEEDIGDEITFDPIGICCEFTEYESIAEFHDNYGSDDNDFDSMEAIQEHTWVIAVTDDRFIIQDF